MKPLLIYLLSLVTGISFGQNHNKECNCPEGHGHKVDTVFTFADETRLMLCGERESGTSTLTYSEFALAKCGDDSVIAFWDGIQTCELKMLADTLYVYGIKLLPVGKNFKRKSVVWDIQKITFTNGAVTSLYDVNHKIPRYNSAMIRKVLAEFEGTSKNWKDSKELLLQKVFVATISGNQKAREYFKDFATRFGELDGAYAEDYKDLNAMLHVWDRRTTQP